jgi:hypothetical protein
MNAIVQNRIDILCRPRIQILGSYDVSDLQRAMRVATGRAHLRSLRGDAAKRSPIGCDIRADGRRVEL